MRILLVEDDRDISSFIRKGFEEAGFAVDRAQDGKEGLALARSSYYDALIVDIMLPGLDGLSLIETLRNEGASTPVLILSARRSVDDKVRGFRTGGDDYLTKPFSFAELFVRIQALIRRAGDGRPNGVGRGTATALKVGDLTLDLLKHEAERDGVRIELNPREFALLEYLMRNTGIVVTKTMILEHVWDYHFDPQTNVVDVLVHRLRTKIDRDFEEKLIHTIRGAGYVIKVA